MINISLTEHREHSASNVSIPHPTVLPGHVGVVISKEGGRLDDVRSHIVVGDDNGL